MNSLSKILDASLRVEERLAPARLLSVWILACFIAPPVLAQDQMSQEMDMSAGKENPAATLLSGQASGTSANPSSMQHEGFHWRAGQWNLMFHGAAFLNGVFETGPRGANKFFSGNWFMGTAEHTAGKGSVQFRAMLSLDPATITNRHYPELFQTGETVYGKPLVDGQHPHDLFMELSLQYARPLGDKAVFNLYFAPVGDPALGPVGFPHRLSASELPQAPLSHHLQDSSHIANEVITTGLHFAKFGIEASGFHGGEPNEQRWNIDYGAIDSWAARLVLTPIPNWSAQISAGRLHRPEALEPGDTIRSTASVSYHRPFVGGYWSTSLIWGRNHKTVEKKDLNSYLIESVVRFRTRNYVTGRIELVDRDELFAGQSNIPPSIAASVFRVAAYTLGYTRDVGHIPGLETGLGANFTLYTVPAAIKPYYDERPASFYLLLRIRVKGKMDAAMRHHDN